MVASGHLGRAEILAEPFELEAAGFEEVDVDAFIGEAYGEG